MVTKVGKTGKSAQRLRGKSSKNERLSVQDEIKQISFPIMREAIYSLTKWVTSDVTTDCDCLPQIVSRQRTMGRR